jgi:hypothetical protein
MEKHMFQTPKTCLLIVLLLAACEESEKSIGHQENGSCWSENDTLCVSYYGAVNMPDQNEPHCELQGGEWSDGSCPDGFTALCDVEWVPDNGIEYYHYDLSEYVLDLRLTACDFLNGIWYE